MLKIPTIIPGIIIITPFFVIAHLKKRMLHLNLGHKKAVATKGSMGDPLHEKWGGERILFIKKWLRDVKGPKNYVPEIYAGISLEQLVVSVHT